jgi:hypothetical protein
MGLRRPGRVSGTGAASVVRRRDMAQLVLGMSTALQGVGLMYMGVTAVSLAVVARLSGVGRNSMWPATMIGRLALVVARRCAVARVVGAGRRATVRLAASRHMWPGAMIGPLWLVALTDTERRARVMTGRELVERRTAAAQGALTGRAEATCMGARAAVVSQLRTWRVVMIGRRLRVAAVSRAVGRQAAVVSLTLSRVVTAIGRRELVARRLEVGLVVGTVSSRV